MKCLILSNQFRSMLVFWRILIKSLLAKGIEVVCCAPPGDREAEEGIEELGARTITCQLDRKGLNPVRDFAFFRRLKKIFLVEKPDILFATTIKPVIYGCAAAKTAGVPAIFATITGLGYVFEADTLPKKALMRLGAMMYRLALADISGVFFQNGDDAALFKKLAIISPDASVFFANGTGVDSGRFSPSPFPPAPPIVFLLIARLLEAKGIPEYASAAALLKRDFPDAKFQLLGMPEYGRGALSLEQVEAWSASGAIDYLGQAKDVRPHIAASHVAVLPSWREGTPTALMEAMAMGRPCVATDAPGCREVVKNGINGWLCAPKDPDSLASAMRNFLADPSSIIPMGQESRKLVEERFEAQNVAEAIITVLLDGLRRVRKQEGMEG